MLNTGENKYSPLKPTEIFMDPYSPEEQLAVESLRRQIAGYKDVVVYHQIIKPPIVHAPLKPIGRHLSLVEAEPEQTELGQSQAA